jgi:hypothetical protein
MKQELDKALCQKYPLIFADRHGDYITTAMCWGFECGDGWYNIIDTLCGAIQTHIDQRAKDIEYRTKINDLVAEYIYGNREPLEQFAGNHASILVKGGIKEVPAPIEQVVAMQVKEKYGSLRFYYGGGDDIIDAYVRFAEYLSERTCDVCGAPGKQRDSGWIVTRCDEHV